MILSPTPLTLGCRTAVELITAPAHLGLGTLDCCSSSSSSLPGRGQHTAVPGRGSSALSATMYFAATRKSVRRGRRGRRGGSSSSGSDSDEDPWSALTAFGGYDGGDMSGGGAGGSSGGGGHAGYNGFGGEFFSFFVYEHFWLWQLMCAVSLIQAMHFTMLGAAKKGGSQATAAAVDGAA